MWTDRLQSLVHACDNIWFIFVDLYWYPYIYRLQRRMVKCWEHRNFTCKVYNLWVTGSSQTCQTGLFVFYLVLPHLGQIPATWTELRYTKPLRHVRTRPDCLDSMLHEQKKIQQSDLKQKNFWIRNLELTTGWVHKVLLLDWHRIRWSCLVHLKQGLSRVLPGGCLFDVAIRKTR